MRLLMSRIAAGRRPSGTLAPATRSMQPEIMSAKRETLRPRGAGGARARPNGGQANGAGAPGRARAGGSLGVKGVAGTALQVAKAEGARQKAGIHGGTAGPGEGGNRFAGEASSVAS